MLVAGSVSFVSCSDDDEEETTQTVEVKTTTNTVTFPNGTAYTYTTVDGKVQTSDSVTVSDDGTITIKADDGSYVTIKGTAITYTNAEGKSSSGTLGAESVTLTGDAGEISATSTSETKTETKTTSGSEATASVTELAYDSDTLNNKVFSYEDEDDGVRYLTFTDGKCYKSSSPDSIGSEKDYLFISCNNKIYRSQKATRTSGSGLFATFDDGDECKYTLNSDGTGIINFTDGDSMSFTFTNNAGLITVSCTYEGETLTGVMYYNGENLYDQKEELTFVKNYKTETKTSGSVSEATASVTELAYDSDTLNNKVFSYEDDDGDGVRYLTFTGGKCYKSTSPDSIGSEKDYLFISCNNKIYRSDKSTRSSGSGLFATFDDGEGCKCTLNSDGTGSIDFYEDSSSFSCTFTNNAGLVTISFTYEGGTMTGAWYYNGENLYDQKEELTFVKNYSAN